MDLRAIPSPFPLWPAPRLRALSPGLFFFGRPESGEQALISLLENLPCSHVDHVGQSAGENLTDLKRL